MSVNVEVNHQGNENRINEIRELFEQFVEANWQTTEIYYPTNEQPKTDEHIEFGLNQFTIEPGLGPQKRQYVGVFSLKVSCAEKLGDQRAWKLSALLYDVIADKRIFESPLRTELGTVINGGRHDGNFNILINIQFIYY